MKKENSCCLRGDGRCDSPRHNVKYFMLSCLAQLSNKVAGLRVIQCTEAGNSNRMEKYAFKKLLDEMQYKEIKISQITTDRHVQIKRCIRENYKDIITNLIHGMSVKT